MKKLLAIATVLSLAISGSALAVGTAKEGKTSPTVKTQQSSQSHSSSNSKAHNQPVKKKTPDSTKG